MSRAEQRSRKELPCCIKQHHAVTKFFEKAVFGKLYLFVDRVLALVSHGLCGGISENVTVCRSYRDDDMSVFVRRYCPWGMNNIVCRLQ